MANLEVIIWKEIKGYEGRYFINNKGEVRSFFKTTGYKLLKPNTNRLGYVYCVLRKNGESKTLTIHRLVAAAFIPNPENKPQVNHINGIKSDNRIENLEWCTKSENQIHAVKKGLNVAVKSFDHYNSRFTKSDILLIRNSELSESKLALIFNVNRATIGKVKRFERYKNI